MQTVGKKCSWVFYDRAVLHAHKICPFGFWLVFVRAGQRLDLLKIQENRFLNSRVLLVGVAMWVDCAKMQWTLFFGQFCAVFFEAPFSETTVQSAQTTVAFESLVPVVFVGLLTWTDLTKRNKSGFVVSAFVGDWVYIESRKWVPAFPKIQMFARLWVLLIVVLYGFIDMKNVKRRRETLSFCWESVNSVNAQIKLRHSPNSYSSVQVIQV